MRSLTLFFLVVVSMAAASQNAVEHAKTAVAVLRAEMAKEGKKCKGANDQREETTCTAQAASAADHNLSIFFDNLKAIVGHDGAGKELEASQRAWIAYRKTTCDAIFEFYKGGSIRYANQSRCEIRLTRERMRDLDYLYESPLHH